MFPWVLYDYIAHIKHSEYNHSGDDVDWIIRRFPEEKKIRLIFEESNSKRDWVVNFNFPIKPYKKQKNTLWVARGWGNAWKSCNDEIMTAFIAELLKPENDGFEPEICGWSYGGAMSILAAEDFNFRTGYKATVVTFGTPKPLFGRKSKRYVLKCVKDVKQYAHKNDCVPCMPPLIGYKHLNKVSLGKLKFFFEWFKPSIYHCSYGDETLYHN